MVGGMLADIARVGPAADGAALRDLRQGWSAMLKGSSGAEVLALAAVFHSRLPESQRWLADDLVRHHPEAGPERT
ncbi:MAG: hypothetical protein JWR84_1660 [Caulobacter sp.]|nr:hypothetical protein [Caulobacter sp.]